MMTDEPLDRNIAFFIFRGHEIEMSIKNDWPIYVSGDTIEKKKKTLRFFNEKVKV